MTQQLLIAGGGMHAYSIDDSADGVDPEVPQVRYTFLRFGIEGQKGGLEVAAGAVDRAEPRVRDRQSCIRAELCQRAHRGADHLLGVVEVAAVLEDVGQRAAVGGHALERAEVFV